MARTIVSLFDDLATAQQAAQELIQAGFSRDQVSVVANDVTGEYGRQLGSDVAVTETGVSGAGAGAGIGAALGGIGGLLVGLGALAIPGIGPIVAAGPLIAALVGAGVGAVAGSLVGALVDMGVPEEEAGYYAEGVRRGGALLTLRTEANEPEDRAMDIINRFQPVDIEQRSSQWRESGWSGFDPNAAPYSSSEMERDRSTYRPYDADTSETGYGEDLRNNPNYGSRGFPEVEPAPGEQTYRGDPSHDPDHDSRGWTEVEPPADESMETGQAASHTRGWPEVEPAPGEQTYRGDPAHDPNYDSRGWTEVEPPADESMGTSRATAYPSGQTATSAGVEGRTDIGTSTNQAWEETKDTVREGWQDVKDTARNAWEETKEAVDFDDDFDTHSTHFREHYTTNYANSGYDYNTYIPAYRYGYNLAYDMDYDDRDWAEIETEARSDWEAGQEGPWEQFKNAVRHAWEETKEAIGLEADEDFKTYDSRFREDYTTNYANSGYDYDTYTPAYRYGYDLAYHPDYDTSNWDEVEPEARQDWETTYGSTWEQFKGAIRHAWEETKKAVGFEEDDRYISDQPRSLGESRHF
jgi:hypothetical protein